MVEVTLENGVTGIGEGYLAVFAPLVFKSIFELCAPYLKGEDGFDIARRVADLRSVCDYWSLQGAARHVISAFDIALHDAKAKTLGIPAYELLGGPATDSIRLYGSGGCCDTREHFHDEFRLLGQLGITLYKIRAVKTDILRTAWAVNEASRRGVTVGVDMCQNLADPPQSADDVVAYLAAVAQHASHPIAFVEEAIGPDAPDAFRELRSRCRPQVCGGEIITTPGR